MKVFRNKRSILRKSFRYFIFLLFAGLFFFISSQTILAETSNKGYEILAPIPTVASGTTPDLPTYLKGLIVLIVGLSIVLSVIMIVIGGIEYVTAGVPSAKSNGKEKIGQAILGLLIALSSYVILITINPDLLMVGFNLETVNPSPAIPWVSTESSVGGGNLSGGDTTGETGGWDTNTGGKGNGKCQPITDDKNHCSVNNLRLTFGSNSSKMSAICNYESVGGQVGITSGSDKCTDGTSVSFGLFQINISANDLDGIGCPGLFTAPFTGAVYRHEATCYLKNGPEIKAKYDACVKAAKTASVNIAKAGVLSSGGTNFKPWWMTYSYPAPRCHKFQ